MTNSHTGDIDQVINDLAELPRDISLDPLDHVIHRYQLLAKRGGPRESVLELEGMLRYFHGYLSEVGENR